MTDIFAALSAEIARIPVVFPVGRISRIETGTVRVTGLEAALSLGDRVEMGALGGEVIGLKPDETVVLPDGSAEGLTIGQTVEAAGRGGIAPHDGWIGRIVDPYGQPLDGKPLQQGANLRPIRTDAPMAARRKRLGARLSTGVAVFDTMLPLVRGQRIGLFAGSGVGKSSLLAKFARKVDADVVVIALVGERGRELREFAERVLGAEGMARSVIVTATSDLSALTRRRCAWTAMAVAEHFRDQGLHVLLLVDSITRFAEAHREVALAAGEPAALRGYPPSLGQTIMALAERAGPGPEDVGDITAIFSVLVAGSDMDEPVADILRGVLDGHVVMDRKIAERGRFPAIDLLRSVSRSLPEAATDEENGLIAEVRKLLGAWDRAELMIQAGLYVKGTDPVVDRTMQIWPALDGFIGEDAPSGGVEASFARLAAILASRGGT
jgi:flagellum-specific ATP synthase